MSGRQPQRLPRYWDSRRQQHYHYDSVSDQLIYQNGIRISRPNDIPRSTFLNPPNPQTQQQQQQPASQSNGSSNYTTTPGTISRSSGGQGPPRRPGPGPSQTGLATASATMNLGVPVKQPRGQVVPGGFQPTASPFLPGALSPGSATFAQTRQIPLGPPVTRSIPATSGQQQQQPQQPFASPPSTSTAQTVQLLSDGTRMVSISAAESQVRSSFREGSADKITDSAVFHEGARANK